MSSSTTMAAGATADSVFRVRRDGARPKVSQCSKILYHPPLLLRVLGTFGGIWHRVYQRTHLCAARALAYDACCVIPPFSASRGVHYGLRSRAGLVVTLVSLLAAADAPRAVRRLAAGYREGLRYPPLSLNVTLPLRPAAGHAGCPDMNGPHTRRRRPAAAAAGMAAHATPG